MANTFGTAAAPKPLYDPRPVRAARRHHLRDDVPDLAHANSIYISGGRWPCRGANLAAGIRGMIKAPPGREFNEHHAALATWWSGSPRFGCVRRRSLISSSETGA